MTLQNYLQQHYASDTAKAYQREIDSYVAGCPGAAHAAYKDVVSYIGVLRSRYSNAATLNRILSSIKAYYDYLCAACVRSDHPARSIRLRDRRNRDVQLQDLFTAQELEVLLYRKERFVRLASRNQVLMSLLIYQALQLKEIEQLTLDDINLAQGTIDIKATATTGKRELQLKPGQILLFYEYIHNIRPKLLRQIVSNALLIGQRGNPMGAQEITSHIKYSYKGMYPGRAVNAQTIRQSVIANLLKAGHDISVVQVFAGHKYPSSTERYKQDVVETLRTAVNKYHPLQ